MKTIASEFYMNRRGNCAQAVINAWQEKTSQDNTLIEDMGTCGNGKAPNGLCGAVYAAKHVLDYEAAEKLLNDFSEITGGFLKCREIRSAKALKCRECVETAAELLHQEFLNNTNSTS